MTIQELADLTGMSYKQIYDRASDPSTLGMFSIDGFGTFKSRKSGKEWNIEQISETPEPGLMGDGRETHGGRLKDALTAMQIKKIQQQLEEGRKAIEDAYRIDLKEKMFEVLQVLPDAYRECKLNKEQADIVTTALKESLQTLRNL